MTKPSTLIGLFGPQRSGKNAVVDRLVTKHDFVALSISAPIKRAAHRFAGREFTDEEKDVPQPSLNGRTPRELYIQFGQLDEYAPNLWVDFVLDAIRPFPGARFVIESVGKQFQFDRILERKPCDNIRLVQIERPGYEWKDTRQTICDFRTVYRIVNDADLQSLYERVDTTVGVLLSNPATRKEADVRSFVSGRNRNPLPSADSAIRNMLRAVSPS